MNNTNSNESNVGLNAQTAKEKFIEIFNTHITREGANKLLFYLEKSDFFSAPASTRFHLSEPGGLVIHSVNVYQRLKALYLHELEMNDEYRQLNPNEEESLAICGLLHDLCKVGVYKPGTRNVKNETTGQWEKVPTFTFEDSIPYGHGEKSVYIISGFMRLSREEAMAIRWHMGFSDVDSTSRSTVGNAFNTHSLAVLTHTADMLATYLDEKESSQN